MFRAQSVIFKPTIITEIKYTTARNALHN